jgi:hypothetical protein
VHAHPRGIHWPWPSKILSVITGGDIQHDRLPDDFFEFFEDLLKRKVRLIGPNREMMLSSISCTATAVLNEEREEIGSRRTMQTGAYCP